jgi:hypothetical protein
VAPTTAYHEKFYSTWLLVVRADWPDAQPVGNFTGGFRHVLFTNPLSIPLPPPQDLIQLRTGLGRGTASWSRAVSTKTLDMRAEGRAVADFWRTNSNISGGKALKQPLTWPWAGPTADLPLSG